MVPDELFKTLNPQNVYSCFSEEGQTNLPKISELLSIIQSNIEPVIFIDSCVCLHIIKVVDYGRKANNIDFSKIISLKEYLHDKPIKLSPFFGLMELCLKDGIFDKIKFRDFKHRIDFFDQIPLKEFKKFKFNFHKDYFIIKDISFDTLNPSEALAPSLLNTYCALLKIRTLAKSNLSKDTAETNINLFLDWMINVLNSVRAAEYKIALNVFGGNSVYRKMIGLDSKGGDVKKKLLGTSWDIFHAKTTSNRFRLSQILGKSIWPYFLTSDSNLFNLFKNFSLRLIKDGGEDFTSSFLLNSDFSYPHLGIDFIDRQNKKMMNIFVERRNIINKFDKEKVDKLIIELELKNEIFNQ
jgi:hypothetical protein